MWRPAHCRRPDPTPHRLVTDNRGAAAIEFAFTIPLALLFIFGVVQVGHALWLQNNLTYSVAEAARCATVNHTTCGTPAQIQSYASSQSGGDFDSSVFSVSTPSCGNQVSASYAMTLSIMVLSYPITLSASACYPS